MNAIPEQIAGASTAGVEALIGYAQAQFAAVERLSALHLDVARSAFDDGAGFAKAALSARDVHALLDLGTGLARPVMEKAFAYSRGCYEVGIQAQDDTARLFESQAAAFNRSAAAYLDRFAKYAPGGADIAVAAVKSALEAGSSALFGSTRFSQRASEPVESKLESSSSADAVAVKESKKKAA